MSLYLTEKVDDKSMPEQTTLKKQRTLELFFRALRGEDLSVAKLAAEHQVSTKTIGRDLAEIKSFLDNNRELVGYSQLQLEKGIYRLRMDAVLADSELFSLVKILLASRALSQDDMTTLLDKLQQFTIEANRESLDRIVRNELRHYTPVTQANPGLISRIWQLTQSITHKKSITITYQKVDQTISDKHIYPASLIFSEFYFYLIGFYVDNPVEQRFFRIDRISQVVEHRNSTDPRKSVSFDEGLLRKQGQLMMFGEQRTVKFWYTGPSIQAVLDKLPTATTIERKKNSHLLEAQVFGDGIKMFLLSQGPWVQVVSPPEFVDEIKQAVAQMSSLYD